MERYRITDIDKAIWNLMHQHQIDENDNTGSEIKTIEELATYPYLWERWPLLKSSFASPAHTPYIPEDILIGLAQDENFTVREQVALRPDLSEKVSLILIHDIMPHIRTSAIQNGKFSQDLLVSLASNSNTEVKIALCQKSELSENVIQILAADSCDEVRLKLVQQLSLNNPVHEKILQTLLHDTSNEIKLAVAEKYKPELPFA